MSKSWGYLREYPTRVGELPDPPGSPEGLGLGLGRGSWGSSPPKGSRNMVLGLGKGSQPGRRLQGLLRRVFHHEEFFREEGEVALPGALARAYTHKPWDASPRVVGRRPCDRGGYIRAWGHRCLRCTCGAVKGLSKALAKGAHVPRQTSASEPLPH